MAHFSEPVIECAVNKSKTHKVLVLLPSTNDRVEANKLDKGMYQVCYLHASDDVKDKPLTPLAYDKYLAQPGFLTSYVDRAVEYIQENGITGIMFGHDLSSIVASVVCERTGLPGPSLESTFRCLHKYYSRKTVEGKLWVDYIHLDDPAENWRDKVSYPCFLKPSCLTASKGCSYVRSEAELRTALAKLKPLVTPFFKGYSEFFRKYLDLEKFPLAVENIAVIEEFMESDKQYSVEGWMDGDGKFNIFCTSEAIVSTKKLETIVAFVIPAFSLPDASVSKFIQFMEDIVRTFGLRNTFFNVEAWKDGDEFMLVEVNSRIIATHSDLCKKMWGVSTYENAVHLACGEIDTLKEKKPPLEAYKDGDTTAGSFYRINTWGEGKAKDFLDLDYARTGSIADGVFNNSGLGAALFVSEDSPVKQISTNGFKLCTFFLIDNNVNRMFERAKNVADRLLLRPEDRDVVKLPIVHV